MVDFKPLTDPAVRAEILDYLEANWPGIWSEHAKFPSHRRPVVCHGRPPAPESRYDWQWLSEHHPLPALDVGPAFDRGLADASLKYFGESRGGRARLQPRTERSLAFRFTTAPVVFPVPGDAPLELGPFLVEFWFQYFEESGFKAVVGQSATALRPCPAIGRLDVHHPHVSGKNICLGEIKLLLPEVVRQARFDDAADYLDSLLRTYDESSPYVKLADWRGFPCPNCDGRSASRPTQCPECDEHVGGCCGSSCPNCDSPSHAGCRSECHGCGEESCPECLNDVNYCTRCYRKCEDCGDWTSTDDLSDDRCPDCQNPSCANCGLMVDDEDSDLDEDWECIRCAGRRCAHCNERRWSDTLDDNGVCEDCREQPCSDCGDLVDYHDLDDGVCRSCRTCTECDRVVDDPGDMNDQVCRRCRTCRSCGDQVDGVGDLDDDRCLTCAPECSDCAARTGATDLVGGRCRDCHQSHLEEMEEDADADADAQV